MLGKPIYLDFNATTPVDKRVAEAMLPYLFGHYGNPSSRHIFGVEAKSGVDTARRQVASMLDCDENEIVFTGGGSESNNLALKGAAYANRKNGNHIITSCVEHPAILKVCDYLQKEGFRITILPVDKFGLVNPEDVRAAITSQTILISVMHANNEVGTIEPIIDISKIAHSHNIVMHTDAAQSVGKIRVQVGELEVDLLSIAGHKLYAPKGVGVLYIRKGTKVGKIMHGADQERNMRAGTENVLEIVGLGKACELVGDHLEEYIKHMKLLRDRLEQIVCAKLPHAMINGDLSSRLPNTSNISFKGIKAEQILSQLSTVAVSAGAACHSGQVEVSHVLKAMQIPAEFAEGTIRFSTGRMTTLEEINRASDEIIRVMKKLESKKLPS